MDKYRNKYRISSSRLRRHDYSSNGMYFVTICTKKREYFFGELPEQLSEMGEIAANYWAEIPKHFPFVELDKFVIMPDHIHGILLFNQTPKAEWSINKFGTQSRNLGSVIRAFKSSLKRYANIHGIPFEWQPRYHDRVIRNEKEFHAIRKYIENNPEKWIDKKGNIFDNL